MIAALPAPARPGAIAPAGQSAPPPIPRPARRNGRRECRALWRCRAARRSICAAGCIRRGRTISRRPRNGRARADSRNAVAQVFPGYPRPAGRRSRPARPVDRRMDDPWPGVRQPDDLQMTAGLQAWLILHAAQDARGMAEFPARSRRRAMEPGRRSWVAQTTGRPRLSWGACVRPLAAPNGDLMEPSRASAHCARTALEQQVLRHAALRCCLPPIRRRYRSDVCAGKQWAKGKRGLVGGDRFSPSPSGLSRGSAPEHARNPWSFDGSRRRENFELGAQLSPARQVR